jgi:hypothetical protein
MDSLLIQARKANNNPLDCLDTIEALKSMKFDNAAFELLHRNKKLHVRDSMDGFTRYCKGRKGVFHNDATNHRVHQRLTYVLLSRQNDPSKGKSFQSLAEEAFRLIPPIV